MTEKDEKLLLVVAAVFLIVSLLVMGYVMIFHRGEIGNQAETIGEEERIEADYFVSMEGEEWDIIIPTPYQETNNLFRIEENIKDRTIEITLAGLEEDYYYEHQVQGNEEKISQIRYQQDDNETRLRFVLKNIYVVDIRQMGGEICLSLEEPMETYEHLVVFDGFQNEDRVLDLEKLHVKGLLNGDVVAANDVRADYYVALSLETIAEGREVTIYYNDDFFIPDFDSKSLAVLLKSEFDEMYGEENVKLIKSDSYGLAEAMLPAVKVVGKISIPAETDMREVLAKQNDEMEETVIKVLTERYQETEE